MAVPLKFIQFFGSLSGYGWSEIHYKLSSSDNPDLKVQLANFWANVGLTRKEMLGSDCSTIGARVSYPRDGVVASKPIRQFFAGNADQFGAAPALSLAVNFSDTTNTRSKTVHLRGFWDTVELNEVYSPGNPAAAGWEDRLVAWKQALITGGYGWLSKLAATSAKGGVSNYVVAASNIVTFTLEAPGMPLATVGTTVQVRFSKLNRSNSVLNKSILCFVTNQTTLTSVNPNAAGAFVSKGRFNFRATAFVPYNDVNSISLGKRQMGKALYLSVARGKVKPTT